jgi:hypothetical protein
MVKLHRTETPRCIVAKPAKGRSHRVRPDRCIVCGATLHHHHRPGDQFCDCHRSRHYKPAADPDFDRRVLDHLGAAWPNPLRLAASLGVDPDDRYGYLCVKLSVARWRRRGVPVKAVKGIGYRLGQ